jgi:hypothetical protein
MSDRAFAFIFSVLVIVAALGACGWLLVSGQAATVDGLFLLLYCGLVAMAFALYVMFLIHRALESLAPPPSVKPAAKASPAAQKPVLASAEPSE